MPRSIWNGTITFGLMRVPIKVHSATEDKGVHFHEVHAKDGAPIKHKRICSKEGKEVPYKQIASGYEVRRGEYVLLEKEEIDAAAGRQSREIELEEFVAAQEIDPSSMTADTGWGPATTDRTPTGSCTTPCSGPAGWVWVDGCSTTGSTWPR